MELLFGLSISLNVFMGILLFVVCRRQDKLIQTNIQATPKKQKVWTEKTFANLAFLPPKKL